MKPMTRTSFRLQYKVKNGTAVMNELGQEVGTVIGCEQVPNSEGQQLGPSGSMVEGPLWEVTADVEEAALKGKLQCMEPTMPVP